MGLFLLQNHEIRRVLFALCVIHLIFLVSDINGTVLDILVRVLARVGLAIVPPIIQIVTLATYRQWYDRFDRYMWLLQAVFLVFVRTWSQDANPSEALYLLFFVAINLTNTVDPALLLQLPVVVQAALAPTAAPNRALVVGICAAWSLVANTKVGHAIDHREHTTGGRYAIEMVAGAVVVFLASDLLLAEMPPWAAVVCTLPLLLLIVLERVPGRKLQLLVALLAVTGNAATGFLALSSMTTMRTVFLAVALFSSSRAPHSYNTVLGVLLTVVLGLVCKVVALFLYDPTATFQSIFSEIAYYSASMVMLYFAQTILVSTALVYDDTSAATGARMRSPPAPVGLPGRSSLTSFIRPAKSVPNLVVAPVSLEEQAL